MSTQDEKFKEQLRATFQIEAHEHLQGISTMLLELEKPSSDVPRDKTIENIYRAAHSLKGAARSVGFLDIEAICQSMESVFQGWKQGRSSPTARAFDTLHHAADTVRTLLEGSGAAPRLYDDLVHRLDAIRTSGPSVSSPAPPIAPEPDPSPTSFSNASFRPETTQTVRVAIEKLDARLLQAEDLLTVKTITAQQASDLREVMGRFQQWRAEWGKFSPEARALRSLDRHGATDSDGHGAHASVSLVRFLEWNHNFVRSLEDRLASLAAQASSDRHNIARRVDDLLQDSKKMLMLPFQSLADSFPRLIRDLCREQGKEVELVIRGGDVEVDKRILEEMKDPFIHILRNCVDHGVEKPAQRELRGKPPRAVITIAVSQIRSDTVAMTVSDDGAGIDVESLKNAAVRQGLISESESRALDERQSLDLIFRSGVSTSPMITAISGRGLGMAIAHAKAEKLGGRIHVESARGVGTILRIELPLTLATFRGVLVRAGDQTYLVPTAHIERVARARPRDIQTVENRQAVSFDGRPTSLVRLEDVLESRTTSSGRDDSTPVPVVVLQSGDQRIAFCVDEVLNEEEVLVKPLPKPLVRVRNIAGATVLGSGKVVAVLSVSDLVLSARTSGAPPALTTDPTGKAKSAQKRVLVVEDSITSRMLLKGILEGAGYRVRIAVDGMDAFTILREELFDLVVSDVEMPRMNGLDLTARIRAEERLSNLPVVLVTALESQDERERGIDAGANAYIVKSSFDQSNLLEVLQRLV